MTNGMNSEQIDETASQWFAKRESGTWTESDQAAFDAWLEAATVHRIAYIRLATAWKHLARIRALGAGVPPGVIPARGSWGDARFFKGTLPEAHTTPTLDDSPNNSAHPEPPAPDLYPPNLTTANRRSARWQWYASAAAVLLVMIGSAYTYFGGVFTAERYSTPVGGLNVVHLIDGSLVTLNTNTSLRVVMNKGQRRIELDKGEAFFEVAHDGSRPFVVYAGNKRVMAVGTKFSVRRESDDVQVVVTEGRVSLATAAPHLLPSPGAVPDGSSAIVPEISGADPAAAPAYPPVTLLRAGTVARTANTEVLVHQQTATESEALLSWRNGYVAFRDTTLADAVNEFNRYNTRKIVIGDPTIADIRIGGNFRANNTDAFLWLLQNGFPIAIEQDSDKVVLRAR
jgi:transmembrane sensor